LSDVLLLIGFWCGVVYLVMHLLSRKRERALDEARASEARFRGLTELSADWYWETDAAHRIVWLSGGGPVVTLFGAMPSYGKRFWEIPQIEVDAEALRIHEERLARQQPFFDLEISRSDGRGARQTHIISGQCLKAADGRLIGYRGVGRDVTGERRVERGLAQAKERLERALDGGGLAEWHLDLATDELYAGDGWVRFLGHERSPPITRLAQFFETIHPEDAQPGRERMIRVLKGELPEFNVEIRSPTRRGGWKWLNIRGRVTKRDAAGLAVRMSGIVADIDERKRAEGAIAEREQRFRDVVEAAGEYVWEADSAWRFTYLSERVEAVLGYSRAELLGRTPQEFMPLGEERAVQDWFARHVAMDKPFRDLVHRSITKSGGVIWQSVNGVPVRDAAGRWIGYRGTAADVTARKQAEARIEVLTARDALTGLPNRLLLAERTGEAIANAARNRSRLALLCIDLDRFRLVNESFGHQAGDALLRAVAERLHNALRREDTLGRIGGDDFVLLWNGLRTGEEAAMLAQRLLSVLGRPFTVDGLAVNVGASIGIALYPEDGRDFTDLLKNADAALYHAKDSGRGTFKFFLPGIGAAAAGRLRVENELRSALARGELLLHWQPVVSSRPGRGPANVVGAEALVRWQHPARGLLMPEDFIPLAEESGLIRAVGDWTLERALSQVGAWQRALPGRPWFALNVSATELAEGEDYFNKLKNCLKANSVDGSRIELEITERALMSHLEENIETLRRVGELGVRFAIDDFGTGYSSLAYLRGLPVDKLKIDRMFLRDIASDPADQAIVGAIASLARALGITVAAEGVENEAQLERLLALGCAEWQGHHFSPSLDPGSFEKLFSVERLASGRD
jgi:diguanylate cyclase (GGDEF)-like protein/PAS domain S-box-containing protein